MPAAEPRPYPPESAVNHKVGIVSISFLLAC